MRTKSKTCLKSTRVSNSILEKRMNLRKVLPKANSDNFNTSPNHLKNNIANKGAELQQQSSSFKELEFIINKDNPTIVEYYTNNSKGNNSICFLNYYPYYWNFDENKNRSSELVQKRKRLFNKDEFWKDFARKVDDLNRSSPSMLLSNYCAKISANHSNESKSPSAYNNANNYCPHFVPQSVSNDMECFKASTNNNSNIEEKYDYSNESTTVSISQDLSESPQQYSSQTKSEETNYRESLVVSSTPLPSESNHHQIYQPSSIAPIFHHYSSSTDSPPSSTQPFSLPSFNQQQRSLPSFSDSHNSSEQLYRQSLFFHHPHQTESDYFSKQIQPNTSKNSEFNAGNATSCLYCDLYFE